MTALLTGVAACDVEQPPQSAAQPASPKPELAMPADEREYIREVRSAEATADAGLKGASGNGFLQDKIYDERDASLCKALLTHRVMRDWVAILVTMFPEIDDTSRASVRLKAEDLTIESEPSFTEPTGPPSAWVKNMHTGQIVTFSGTADLDLEHANRKDCNPVVTNPVYVNFKSIR